MNSTENRSEELMHRVIIWGAGKIGSAIAKLLHYSHSYDVWVADTHPHTLKQLSLFRLFTMSNSAITVTVKLFAAFQEAYGVPELVLQFPSTIPVASILQSCIDQHPQLEQWRNVTQFGVNCEFVTPDTLLKDGDEVVLIPPVSGG